jgi:outer membrane protein assembly factor BamB
VAHHHDNQGNNNAPPVIGSDGTIYVGAGFGGYLLAVNPDGTSKSTYACAATTPSRAADGTIFFWSSGNVIALNPNGALKWSYAMPDYVHSSPAIGSDGTTYLGCDDRKLLAIGP